MIVGKLVESAALGLKQTLVQHGFTGEFQQACQEYVRMRGPLKSSVTYQAPPDVFLGRCEVPG